MKAEKGSPAAKAKRMLMAIEIPRDELACRIAERCINRSRPLGMTATEALAQLTNEFPDIVAGWRAAADAAVLYMHECISTGKAPH